MKQNKQKWILIGAGCAAAALVAAILIIALSGGTEGQVLERYYAAMYTSEGGGMETLLDCLAPELREEYYNNITMGGVNFHQLGAWQLEAVSLAGDRPKVSVKVVATGGDSSSALAELRQQYAGVEQAHTVSFRLTLSGEEGTAEFLGMLPMARINGRWYLLNNDANLARIVDD